MKIAKVIAIHKKGNSSKVENYRPISLLPAFSKILERLIYNRLFEFLNKHNVLSPSQYGFQKNMSTEYAITELQDRIVKDLASNKWTIGILLDLSKAFDTLDHSILIAKLGHLGIRGIPQQWFKSYLSGRKQFTSFKNSSSPLAFLSCGVPQGSILGPLLFLIYVNDILNILKDSKAILFADDTNLLFSDKDLKTLIQTINVELASVKNWFSANRLSLNIEKTSYILFHKYQRIIPEHDNIKIGSTTIQRESSAKFLGVQIDETLSWKKHINTKANQVVRTISILSRLKNSVSTEILKTIYNALVLPHISYAIVSWGNVKSREISRFKLLQKKAVRLITNSKYNSHTNPIFRKLNLLKLDDIYTLQCTKLLLKYKQCILPQYHSEQLETTNRIHHHFTRNRHELLAPQIRTTIEEQLFSFKISQTWNSLSDSIKDNIRSHNSTGILKDYLISKYNLTCLIPDCHCKN